MFVLTSDLSERLSELIAAVTDRASRSVPEAAAGMRMEPVRRRVEGGEGLPAVVEEGLGYPPWLAYPRLKWEEGLPLPPPEGRWGEGLENIFELSSPPKG